MKRNIKTFEEYSVQDPYGEEIENDVLKEEPSELKFKVGDDVYYEDFSDASGVYTVKKAYISEHGEHLYDIEEDGNIGEDISETELIKWD